MLILSLDIYFIVHSAHMQTFCIRVVYILSDRCCKLLIPWKSYGLNLKSLNISNCCSMQYNLAVKMTQSFTETNKHLTFLIKPQVSTWFFYRFFNCFCTWQQCSWKKERKKENPRYSSSYYTFFCATYLQPFNSQSEDGRGQFGGLLEGKITPVYN